MMDSGGIQRSPGPDCPLRRGTRRRAWCRVRSQSSRASNCFRKLVFFETFDLLRHQPCFRNQSYVRRMPSSRSRLGRQPSCSSFVTSSFLCGVHQGLCGIPVDLPPETNAIAQYLREIAEVNVLTGADVDGFVVVIGLDQRNHSARDVLHVEQVPTRATCSPKGDLIDAIRTCFVNLSHECRQYVRRMSPHGTCPPGPYRFVGIAEMKEHPYWRRSACTCRTPAIFAIAYASFVGSNGPVSRDDSRIGCSANFG